MVRALVRWGLVRVAERCALYTVIYTPQTVPKLLNLESLNHKSYIL